MSEVVRLAFVIDEAFKAWDEDLVKYVIQMLNDKTDGWYDDLFSDGTTIEYEFRHASCEPSSSSLAYWDMRSDWNGTAPHGVIGARCSSASMELAVTALLENVSLLSPGSSSVQLSDKSSFPLASRVMAADDSAGQAGALVALLSKSPFQWDRVSIITTDEQYSRDLSTSFQNLWIQEGGSRQVAYMSEVKIIGDRVDEESVQRVLDNFPSDPTKNSRIVLLIGREPHAYEILRRAHQTAAIPSDVVWIGTNAWSSRVPTNFDDSTYHQGYIGITPFRNRDMHYEDFLERLNRLALSQTGALFAEELPDYLAENIVDSILAFSMALSSLDAANRTDGERVTDAIRKLSFDGVSGKVAFTEAGDRANPVFTVFNTQLNASSANGTLEWKDVGTVTGYASNVTTLEGVCFPQGCGLTTPPGASYPVPPASLWALIVSPLIGALLLIVIYRYRRSKKKKERIKTEFHQEKQSLTVELQSQAKKLTDTMETARAERETIIKGQFEKPSHWSDDPDDTILVEVGPHHDEYWTILDRLRKKLPDAHISMLWRVQNRSLWSFYTFHKFRFGRLRIDPCETEVWHGTSNVDPDVIYRDHQDGFMMQLAQQGLWGRAIYFAEHSSYSDNYSYTPSGASFQPSYNDRARGLPDEKEMFAAKLLVGAAVDLPNDRTLTVPPLRSNFQGQRYNTVTGVTGGSPVYMVYENGRAYPEYLVRYYRGKRDPTRTPFETPLQAKNAPSLPLSVLTSSLSSSRTDGTLVDVELDQATGDDASGGGTAVWEFFQDENSRWIPYNDNHQALLESAWHRKLANVQFTTDTWTYEVNMVAMVQTNIEHSGRRQREVRRRLTLAP